MADKINSIIPVFCSECKNGFFDDYGQVEWVCEITKKLNPISRNSFDYESCRNKNKDNNCSDFKERE